MADNNVPRAFGASVSALSDADAASVSDLAAHRRARTTIADLDAAFRAALVTDYVRLRAAGGDWVLELRLLADAARYDAAHPAEDSLYDELHAVALFGEQPVEGVAA